ADYLSEIKPLLRERCSSCHGSLKQKAGLRIDSIRLLRKGGDNGPIIVPGDASKSLLFQRISHLSEDERMPPPHEGAPFSAEELHRVKEWIVAGAQGPENDTEEADPREHWSFRPIAAPAIPSVKNLRWVKNPIDRFIAAKHEALGLRPNPETQRSIQIRRLYLDLIGLPPSLAEMRAAESDSAENWHATLVDRLLADPRYGERWARHWMDIWRYSDWWGLGDQLRNSQKHIWHWRDWIVESLNQGVPYDEMIRLMLAADEYAPNDLRKLRASGFLARNYFLFNRNQWLEETVEHVAKGFLGLTMNCAKCHDHKYDPISQMDFYRMRAFFEPHHARTDLLPGESDPSRDGIPRVFDGLLDAPTYRFIRGQENQPDKSAPVSPGVPELFSFTDINITPVELPAEAAEPERRSWIYESRRQVAQAKIVEAQEAFSRCQKTSASETNAELARLRVKAAQEKVESARMELSSLELRFKAMQSEWDRSESLKECRQNAIRAERGVQASLARWKASEAEMRLAEASPDKREAATKEAKAALENWTNAVNRLQSPILEADRFDRIAGAYWTPTRFLDSTKDDPPVKFPSISTGRRRALADWVTHPRHPLTARVAVNHLWARHFGAPLVSSPFDFGRKTSPPPHRELLDWLARDLIDNRWDLKRLHRWIVNSAAYRMSSTASLEGQNAIRDPDNQFWWRRQPIRIEAQAIRDAVLFHSGELELRQGGPPVPPSEQAGSKRRSLYFTHSNNDRNPFLSTFDDAGVKECYRRDQSVTPQQALAMANSLLVQSAAPKTADRITGAGMDSDSAYVGSAFKLLLGFAPSPQELAASLQAMADWRASLVDAEPSVKTAKARANLAWALMNHNDFLTVR
ncbi:MAG: DUF1553 domain-containing protein, partial [Verrucomicrobia bacterium]|nr:DUF1553 domain-containing protein [Verrucomicrobiota bacterium]